MFLRYFRRTISFTDYLEITVSEQVTNPAEDKEYICKVHNGEDEVASDTVQLNVYGTFQAIQFTAICGCCTRLSLLEHKVLL